MVTPTFPKRVKEGARSAVILTGDPWRRAMIVYAIWEPAQWALLGFSAQLTGLRWEERFVVIPPQSFTMSSTTQCTVLLLFIFHSLGDGQLLSRPPSEEKCAVLSDKEDLPSVISEEVCHVYSGKCHELMNYLFKPQWIRAASSLAARSNRLFWDSIKLLSLRLEIATVSGRPKPNSFWNIKESLYQLQLLHCIFMGSFSTKLPVNLEHLLLASLQHGLYQKSTKSLLGSPIVSNETC